MAEMSNLLVYGSLVNTMESSKYHIAAEQLAPVKVRGDRRLFNQETRKRRGRGRQRAGRRAVAG